MKKLYSLIRLNQLVKSHRIKFAAIFLAHVAHMRHLIVRLDPIIACNLSCVMCYFSAKEYRTENKGTFSRDELERIAGQIFPLALQCAIGCGTEPTMYKGFNDLVVLGKRFGVPFLTFTTNGQLLTQEQLEQFVHDGLNELTLSVHGVMKNSYERFMVGASYEKLHALLETATTMKKKHADRFPEIRINYTVNADNLDELERFFDVFGGYTINTLQVRPVMDIGGQYRTMLTKADLERYRSVVGTLREESRQREIVFISNVSDATYDGAGYESVIVEAVQRYVSPQHVWKDDYEWKRESYRDYCNRSGWIKDLLRAVTMSKELVQKEHSRKYAGRYTVETV
jgi:MoaA/NifB/PqqE/SkfB family radical SAM enzyme